MAAGRRKKRETLRTMPVVIDKAVLAGNGQADDKPGSRPSAETSDERTS